MNVLHQGWKNVHAPSTNLQGASYILKLCSALNENAQKYFLGIWENFNKSEYNENILCKIFRFAE